jgi:hypothetical protein
MGHVRHLVRALVAFRLLAIDFLRAGPPLETAETIMGRMVGLVKPFLRASACRVWFFDNSMLAPSSRRDFLIFGGSTS